MSKKTKQSPKPLTPEEAKEVMDFLDKVVEDFEGNIDNLQRAMGMYLLGRHIGWKALVLIYSKPTIRKYEEILGIDIREEFDEEGPGAMRSLGYRVASKLSNFWKAVSGDIKLEDRRVIQKG